MKHILENKKIILLLLAVDVLVMALVFSVSGFFNDGVDTTIYVSQINQFDRGVFDLADTKASLRFFKPFYGVVGLWLVPFLSPYSAIFLMNVSFFILLSIVSFFLFLELGFDKKFSVAGAMWVITGYPMLKYGLALGTDAAGWFFSALTILAVLIGSRLSRTRYFILAALIGFLGALTKESGVLGLVFGGVYILVHIGVWNYKKIVNFLAGLVLPFLILEAFFLFIMAKSGFPTFLDWYSLNLSSYAKEYYKLFYFIGVEASSFNIILVFSLFGIFYAIKKKEFLSREWLARFSGLFVASLPVLMWPIFISRILYIQFLFFIPLALFGVANAKILNRYLFVLPPLFNIFLFLISGNNSLFEIFKNLLK